VAISKSPDGAVMAAAIAILVGTAGGYAIDEMARRGREGEAQQKAQVDAPTDEEASTAIAKSGRSMRISECKPRQAVPGVACTGIITTTTGSFAGSTQPGVLSFARIDGTWAQIQ